MKTLNDKGAVLIAVYMVLFILMAMSSSVAMFNFSELRESCRHRDATSAFWLAEAGVNLFMADPDMLDDVGLKTIDEGIGTIRLHKDDSNPRHRLVLSTGTVKGIQRSIQIKYPALSTIFENTLSTKGNMVIKGRKSSVMVNDKMRLGGSVIHSAKFPLVFFEDMREGISEQLVAITYPDANHNSVADEFGDFIAFNRKLISQYSEDEIVYIRGNATYTIIPDKSLAGKKIIYIEGDREGEGNAVIQFSGALEKGQNLTVIATGTVTHNQTGSAQKNSQLNIIAWGGYSETAMLPSVHNGMIYTHGTAYFDEVHDTSVTNGSVVANEGIVIGEIWSMKTFNYADMRRRGVVPPGFEGLVGGGVSGYAQNPSTWEEI